MSVLANSLVNTGNATLSHPLETLTGEEILQATNIFKASGAKRDECFFSTIQLIEPTRDFMQSYSPGQSFDRHARIIGTGGPGNTEFGIGGFDAIVDITNKKILNCVHLPDTAQAPYNDGDFAIAFRAVFSCPEYIAALAKRGITMDDIKNGHVDIDPWPGGGFIHESIPAGHRSMKAISFYKDRPVDNYYNKPIENIIAHIDLTAGKVAHVSDGDVVPLPPGRQSDHYDPDMLPEQRTTLKPIEIIQPEGPSFTVEGHNIKWQNWDLRISMHPVHALVLHDVKFHDRDILYRASLSDMVVPYTSDNMMHHWKHVLDASEYSIGHTINSLELGCDCLGSIYYFDTHRVKGDGGVKTDKNGICLHEEDFGIAWKHSNARQGVNVVRRNRRLVISSFHTVGNYDYGFYWYLYLDGLIEFEVKLTGIVGVSAENAETLDQRYAPLIGLNLSGPLHQHLFSVRMEWALDGGKCSLYEDNVEAVPIGEDNPNGTIFRNNSTLLKTENEAKRNINPFSSRKWKIVSSGSKNALGNPVAYKVLAGAAQRYVGHHSSFVAKRAPFCKFNLFATPFAPGELSAGGDSPVMSTGGLGLDLFTQNNRSIVDCNLVTWHTTGLTHVPRPEDWPIMPTEMCKIAFMPSGFFDKNPVLDLPGHDHSKHHHHAKL